MPRDGFGPKAVPWGLGGGNGEERMEMGQGGQFAVLCCLRLGCDDAKREGWGPLQESSGPDEFRAWPGATRWAVSVSPMVFCSRFALRSSNSSYGFIRAPASITMVTGAPPVPRAAVDTSPPSHQALHPESQMASTDKGGVDFFFFPVVYGPRRIK